MARPALLGRRGGSLAALATAAILAAGLPDWAFARGNGNGSGGGGRATSPSATPETPLDPRLRDLRDLTKRLSAELHLDSQKRTAVQTKELQQATELQAILDNLPPGATLADIQAAKNALHGFNQAYYHIP